jgi:hypothetical protein
MQPLSIEQIELLDFRLEYCPDCHLGQISLRKGADEHVLHCDGSLKGLAIPRI